jgi:hypothetical protein
MRAVLSVFLKRPKGGGMRAMALPPIQGQSVHTSVIEPQGNRSYESVSNDTAYH